MRWVNCLSAVVMAASVTAFADEGQDLFVEKCAMCHREGGMGTMQLSTRFEGEQAWLENRENLNKDFVEFVVRNGLGIMFSISKAEVSDPQLARIADYLSTKPTE